jgi:hypothetical protein
MHDYGGRVWDRRSERRPSRGRPATLDDVVLGLGFLRIEVRELRELVEHVLLSEDEQEPAVAPSGEGAPPGAADDRNEREETK